MVFIIKNNWLQNVWSQDFTIHVIHSFLNYWKIKCPIDFSNQQIIALLTRFINFNLIFNARFHYSFFKEFKVVRIVLENLKEGQSIEVLQDCLSVNLRYKKIVFLASKDSKHLHQINRSVRSN